MRCPKCGGKGEVKDANSEQMIKCPKCQGLGHVRSA